MFDNEKYIKKHRTYKINVFYGERGYGKVAYLLRLYKKNKIKEGECINQLIKIFK